LPKLLYNEFKYFFNMFFLLTALSQFVPSLKVGLLITYVAPLIFVLAVTMLKEAYDDF
jgi:phospholipid-translocating ATPase